MKIVKEKNPEKCPWKELGVDLVVESSGKFLTYDAVKGHLDAGAKKVVLTGPSKCVN